MEFLESLVAGVGLLDMTVPRLIMVLLSLLLIYLAIVKKYEPLLLLPVAFGMLIANMPMPEALGIPGFSAHDEGGLLFFLYQGIRLGIYPPLIFLCLGCMTDFGPLISSPKSALIGLGGQLGIFAAFGAALLLGNVLSPFVSGFNDFAIQDGGFTLQALREAAVVGIIGSSDGPTSIFLTNKLAEDLLPTIAIAAYSYMALVPIIQPPIMRLLTTENERKIVMPEPKRISKRQRIIFPIAVSFATLLLVPAAGGLISMLMLGNLIRESGVTERYVRTFSNELMNILTFLIGISIGATATADRVLDIKTVVIIFLGLLAFGFGTVGGVLIAKLLNVLTGGKVNPL
ncbi:MAG: sodium ion-translocating decarboxylase subunit beta, partial [Defluviitaleaceae bacterium]|nr:sodium ion-translocating decarboxylase subunit beta [Defluviitaleaceae bacterium]